VIVALGAVLAAAGVALLFDIAGAAAALTRRVTSRSLGTLAPGYAATRNGLRVYAVLLIAVGVAVAGIGVAGPAPLVGVILVVVGVVAFAVASVVVILGEVRVYRALGAGAGELDERPAQR
jgi:hypothetical protein